MRALHLRVDVCTHRALTEGVRGVLDVLRRAGARATFFVAFGPDASGLALRRLLSPSFLAKMVRTRAPSMYGWRAALYGTLLPSPLIGAAHPDLVRRIRDEGHEVGMHGWDHRRWQDGLRSYPPARLRHEFAEMHDAYVAATGGEPTCFAAPAWVVTSDLLACEGDAGLAFASDCRGTRPFLPTLDGRRFRVPQLPVTLPTLDELMGRVPRGALVTTLVDTARAQGDYACFAAHAETEGLAHRQELAAILARVDRTILPLGEARRSDLAPAEIRRGRIAGRSGHVALQSGP